MKIKRRMSSSRKTLIDRSHKTKDTLVAYFDILGYKQLVETNFMPEDELIGQIERITEDVHKTKKLPFKNELKCYVYSFSDNYTIAVDYPEEVGFIHTLSYLIWILEMIQCQFLSLYGILIRGAITRGNIYTGNNFIYGKGLINAYEIENSKAIYPRIVVDSDLIKECMGLVSDFFPEPVLFQDVVYDPMEITTENLFYLFPKMILGKVYNSGQINKKKIDARLKREKDGDLIVVCKDFDSEYYVDYLQYLFYLDRYPNDFDDLHIFKKSEQEELVDLFTIGLIYHIARYIKTFGGNHKLLKKYLWVCIKVNDKLNKLGYKNLFNKATILELCNLDLSSIYTEDETLQMFIDILPDNVEDALNKNNIEE